jgi:hypothetical protein
VTIITEIDDRVFAESWEPAFQRVFGPRDGSAWAFWQEDREPMPVAWRFVPMLDHLTHPPSARYPHHDDGRDVPVLEAVPFLATLRSLGRTAFCLRHGRSAWLLPPTEEASEQARLTLSGLIGCYYLFDDHADWGVLCDWDAEVSIVGGDEAFIEAYLRQSGGEDAVIQRFRQFDFGRKWGDAMRPWSDAYRNGLYQVFGWDAPSYPNHGERFDRRPDDDEFQHQWLPVLERLITKAGSLATATPAWVTVPFRGHVVTEGGGQYEFGVSNPHPKLDEYNALLFILTSDDQWELCMVDLDTALTAVNARIMPPTVWALDVAEFAGRRVATFGRQGNWVLLSLPGGASLLAGEPSLMKRVTDRAGGLDACKERFDAWAAAAELPAKIIHAVRDGLVGNEQSPLWLLRSRP